MKKFNVKQRIVVVESIIETNIA